MRGGKLPDDPELREAILELRRTYGTGLVWIRLGAAILWEGRELATRPLSEKPPELVEITDFWCQRVYPDIATMRAKHVDVHGMKARCEQHVFGYVDRERGVVYTDGKRMDEP